MIQLAFSLIDRLLPAAQLLRPSEWFDRFVGFVARWLTSEKIRVLAANASLFLIVGGLSILFIIVLLLMLQSFFPDRQPVATDAGRSERQLRPTLLRRTFTVSTALTTGSFDGDQEEGLQAGRKVGSKTLDQVLDQVLAKGLGEPRILQHGENYTVFRFLACYGCARAAKDGNPQGAKRCGYERGFLQGALQSIYGKHVIVRESSCHRSGNASCEYEVWH